MGSRGGRNFGFLLIFYCTFLDFDFTLAHIRLTYPPARYPDLDFLDNKRTDKPCGIAKPEEGTGLRTSLLAGSTINVTWFMSYPHKGGFRIELLDENDQPIKVLTPRAKQYTGTYDQTLQRYEVKIPNVKCGNCGIRLLRQAKEWKKYVFWSCADINIIKESKGDELCSFHGTYSGGSCACDRLYSGNACQYKDECWSDEDCGSNGNCQEFHSEFYPKKVCYCKMGYFGERCELVSPIKRNQFQASLYNSKTLNDDNDKLYWRIVEETNEVEVIGQFATRSWVAIGWKSQNIDENCASLSALSSLVSETETAETAETETAAEPETSVPEGESSSEPESESEPEVDQTDSVPESESTIDSKDKESKKEEEESTGEPVSEPESDFESEEEEEEDKTPKSSSEQDRTQTETPSTSKPQPTSTSEHVTFDHSAEEQEIFVGEPEVVGDVCYGDWRWPAGCRDCDYRISWSYVDETDEIEFSVETKAPSNWWTGLGFSRTGSMIDADMVIVKSRNGRLTLHDMVSTDYSAPSEDTQQDVYTPTVVGTHINGVMRATFTRTRDTGDVNGDVIFTDTDCFYFLFPVSGGRLEDNGHLKKHITSPVVSKKRICISSCIAEGETLRPSIPGQCQTEYRFPSGCEGSNCDYVAKWLFYDTQESVHFEITSRELGRWTGIGFSRDGNMTNSDIYTGWYYDGQAYITDRFAYSRQLPAIDPSQDLTAVGGQIEDDFQTIWFTRKVVTGDTLTDYSLEDCYYFLFPVGGGRVLARSEEDFKDAATPIGFHDLYQPRVSREKICVCTEAGESAAAVRRRKRQAAASEGLGLSLPLSEPEPKSEAESKPKSNLHPMDCTDMVVGSVVGNFGRVKDYYTISRATPRLDEFYGGEQSITAAMAFEENNVTTIMFRKKLTADDSADSSISYDEMTLVWAKGQEHGAYSHKPRSALETPKKVKNKNYYETDRLMYHGSKNRGSMSIDFFEKAEIEEIYCQGGFAYPKGCKEELCTYNLTWYRGSKGVHFILDTKISTGSWSGVGFSRDGLMAEADMILAIVKESGEVEVTDRYSEGYGTPTVDESQNIFNVEAHYSSGRLMAKFSRAMVTEDNANEDADFTNCQYFLYPYSGGVLHSDGTAMRKHRDTPMQSGAAVCLSQCISSTDEDSVAENEVTGESEPESTSEHGHDGHGIDLDVDGENTVGEEADGEDVVKAGNSFSSGSTTNKYQIQLHILNEDWDDSLNNPHSERYKELSERVLNAVGSLLSSRFSGYQSSKVLSFSPGSVYVIVEVIADGVSESELVEAIKPSVSSGQIEGLEIDSQSILVSPVSDGLSHEEIRNWIIIGIACILVVVAIIFAICMVVKTKKSKTENFNGYAGTYPGAAYQYPPGALPDKTKSFDNQGYQSDYATGGRRQHNRQFSNATTASPNGKTPSPNSDGESPAQEAKAPVGTGETTYQEWYNRVATHPASQSHQEVGDRTPQATHGPQLPMRPIGGPGRPLYRPGTAGPYVSYPNDPYNYYTLNGQTRFGQAPAYYRPY